jgi:hypothetical protein
MNFLEKIKKFHSTHKNKVTGVTRLQDEVNNCNNSKNENSQRLQTGYKQVTEPLAEVTELKFCPAMGKWPERGPGYFCFYRAYFEGRSGQPIHLDRAQQQCPILKKNSGGRNGVEK